MHCFIKKREMYLGVCEALKPLCFAEQRVCACGFSATWYWLVRRALLRSRLWLVSLRPLSSPSRRVRSSWELLSSALSTEPWASSSACDADPSLCWACSLKHPRAAGLYSRDPHGAAHRLFYWELAAWSSALCCVMISSENNPKWLECDAMRQKGRRSRYVASQWF